MRTEIASVTAPTTPPAPLAYKLSQVPKIAPIGRTSLYELSKAGKLPLYELGRSVVVLHADLMRVLTETRRAA